MTLGHGQGAIECLPLAFEEVLHGTITRCVCLQTRSPFASHFFPRQFGVAAHEGGGGECESVVQGLHSVMMDIHPNWAVI